MSSSKINETIKSLVHGVYIIGVKYKAKINGMTAAWVSQVSSKPPMISVAIGKNHYTADLIHRAKSFSINFLSSEQHEWARKCGFVSGRDQDKLDKKDVVFKVTGTPILRNCAAYLECNLVQQIEVGDHILFLGIVVNADNKDKPLLIYKSQDFFNNQHKEENRK